VRAGAGLAAAVFAASAILVSLASAERAATRLLPVRLVVSPSAALLDQRVDVRVTGLRPGQLVKLEAATRDVLGRRWRSRLPFRASRSGVVDTHSAP
jgi:hypothetical protein